MSFHQKILLTFGFLFLFSGSLIKILHWEFGPINGALLIAIAYLLLFTAILLYIWRKPKK
jgi:drug/metabolite transporter (DMT)-like permease